MIKGMNENKFGGLKSAISNYVFNDDLEGLLKYIVNNVLLRSKRYSIYFENETILIHGGFNNPQLILKRLYYDKDDKNLYIEVQENNKTECISKILFNELIKENIIMISLKLLDNDLYKNQTLYMKKSSVDSLIVQCDNLTNTFKNELKNYLIEKYDLDNRYIVSFENLTPPIWIEDRYDYSNKFRRLSFQRIVLTIHGIELITPDNTTIYLNNLTYDSLKNLYYVLK